MISRIISPRGFLQSLRAGTFCKLGACYSYSSEAASALQKLSEPSETRSACGLDDYADVDWDNLGFSLVPTDFMYIMKSTKDNRFEEGQLNRFGNIEISPSAGVLNYGQWQLNRFGNIEISPSAGVLNYGQGVYEGTKAYRREDGRLLLFRPDQNAIRMKIGAERMCMPAPSSQQFIDAVKHTALANKRWVPPPGKGSLYIRPLLIGSGPILGLAPAPEYTFLVYASPVRNYFNEGSKPLTLYVEHEYDRASRRGTGGVKTIANYAPVLKAQLRAKSRGFSDVLYLDSLNKKNLEEVSSCNIFIVKGNLISTPLSNGTILEGITRNSVMEIARDRGYEVKERAIPVDDLLDADEVFCTGTAVSVAPVGSITYQDKRIDFKTDAQSVCRELLSALVGIQTGQCEDKNGWVVMID